MTENHAGSFVSTLRQRVQAKFRFGKTRSTARLSAEETRLVLRELSARQIDLEAQNAELRQRQAELEKGQARCFDLYNLAPVGYVTLDEQGLILEANIIAAGEYWFNAHGQWQLRA